METTIKLIIFDLDGGLISSKTLHYEALNKALEEIDPKYIITPEEHILKYDGNPTKKKLELLTIDKNLPKEYHEKIWNLKQEKTKELINNLEFDNRIINVLKSLKDQKYKLYCASNSISDTLDLILKKKGFYEYFDYIISNNDVNEYKPFPEIYFRCLIKSKLSVREVLICEDSFVGKTAALTSGCHLCPINDVKDLTLEK